MPDSFWDDRSEGTPFWQLAYHTLYYVDLYFSDSTESFTPPPFHVANANLQAGHYPWFDPPLTLGHPDVTFSKEQVAGYLLRCWGKAETSINTLTPERAAAKCGFFWYDLTVAELVILNLRHLAHHTGQLAAAVRRRADVGVDWSDTAKTSTASTALPPST